jgi:hypothetical protein
MLTLTGRGTATRPSRDRTPMEIAAGVALCVIPFVLLLIAPWLGLRVAVGVALAVLAGIAAVCWLLCTVGGPTRSPGEGRRDEP